MGLNVLGAFCPESDFDLAMSPQLSFPVITAWVGRSQLA